MSGIGQSTEARAKIAPNTAGRHAARGMGRRGAMLAVAGLISPHLERRLRGIGVIRALEAEGFRPGDEVQIAGVAFNLDPES